MSAHVHKILDVRDIASNVRNLNQAVFMAASDLSDKDQMNGIQAVVDEINNKLLVIDDRLEELMEVLA